MNKRINIRALATCAMLSAIAFILQFIELSVPIVPSFIKLDVSDLPALIGSFVLGPWWGVAIQFVKNLIHLGVGSTAGAGELCNFLLGSVFALAAGYTYRFMHTRKGAVLASVLGSLAMALVSLPLNYFFVYPAYVVVYNMPLEAILGMYKEILPAVANFPSSNTLFNCLLVFNIPFTFVKGLLVCIICHIVYKPISRLYHK